ncbi:hypothetical protein M409DRAFT_61238 [Zasmidium cellare ATCC 36951]|uniref:Phytase-like domain-containing protein n=1 Tax=Zasmidium cellare ATCC 36951 TaxID=1080233 RepID=A0A6A6BY75_ZASCE|nr:uncharacterized protein M409DRAFT_61238 [Zasmidium cellare ATCC 36951]KAF2158890.1 hypothetical protein M409DRAFT_61238 [Zasmidium cellare ATCC 36951]
MLFSKSLAATVPLALSSLSLVTAVPQWHYGGGGGHDGGGNSSSAVNTTTCGGKTYVYEELAGYGKIASNARDKAGDTLGGIGSSITIDARSWRRVGKSYTGLLYAVPDRGWNTEGTLNYQARIQKFLLTFTPNEDATVQKPGAENLRFKLLETILLTDPSGQPAVGLDGGINGPYLSFPGFPDLPSANYTGDGFGGAGPGGYRVSLDCEGIALARDGSFWISDEYGDYVYKFNSRGRMVQAIRPPDAFIPIRNNSESFSSDNPPRYNPELSPVPEDPTSGRANNQGLEGFSVNPAGTRIYALTQSALIQDGGSKNKNSRYARLLEYDITGRSPRLVGEYVVPLNREDHTDNPDTHVARQSELHYISDTQFLTLARDSDHGRGQGPENTESTYRQIDVFDISDATNVAGKADCQTCQIASSKGVLQPNVTASEYCQWLDFNVNSQLNRFGVHNGGAEDEGLLNEKWESIALVPVDTGYRGKGSDEYYLLSFSDNDYITQDGYLKGGEFTYSDEGGYNLDNQALIFKVKLPGGAKPLVG